MRCGGRGLEEIRGLGGLKPNNQNRREDQRQKQSEGLTKRATHEKQREESERLRGARQSEKGTRMPTRERE
jgi:hypothetical protein